MLPSRSVSQSSVDKCFGLVRNSASSLDQQNFAISALSRVPGIPAYNWRQFVRFPRLHRSILTLAVRHNDIDIITLILESSDDFGLIDAIKPLLSFLDEDLVTRFIVKTAPATALSSLFSAVDLFTNGTHLLTIFDSIRRRSIVDVVARNEYAKLKTALMKFPPGDLEKFVLAPFDDFALLACVESSPSVSSFCWNLVSPTVCVSIPVLFLIALKLSPKLSEYIDAFFAILQRAERSQTSRCLVPMGVFMLATLAREPFLSIRLHYEANPCEIDSDVVLALIPSLFAASPLVKTAQFDVIEKADLPEYSDVRDEIVSCLKLKKL
jgi:hypothetical protein